jgi:hypothetical protein
VYGLPHKAHVVDIIAKCSHLQGQLADIISYVSGKLSLLVCVNRLRRDLR